MIGKLKLGNLVHNLLEVQEDIKKLLESEYNYTTYLTKDILCSISLEFKRSKNKLVEKYELEEFSEDCTKILEYLNNNPKLEYRMYKKYGIWSCTINFK